MEEGSPVVRQGVRPAGAGDGLPIVAAQEQRRRGGSGWGGPWLGHWHGPAQTHSADFDLKRISKLNTI
jgi:hypothetical protein